jgi:hypothetical protein
VSGEKKKSSGLFFCGVLLFPLLFMVVLITVVRLVERYQRNAVMATVATPEQRAFFTAARRGDLAGLRAALARGQDVNAREPAHGRTALMRAAAFDRKQAVEVLLAAGADVRLADFGNHTAAQIAAEAGAEDLAALLSGARPQ